MSTNLVLRRLHLYLGLFLLPFFVMYGVTSAAFNHPEWFRTNDTGPAWIQRSSQSYEADLSRFKNDREFGAHVMRDLGRKGAYGVYRPPGKGRIEVIQIGFINSSRAVYLPEAKQLLIEDRVFRWQSFLTGMHARHGYLQDEFLNDLWAFLIDLVSVTMFVWMGTGLYLWWKRKPTRVWGWAAILGGFVVIAAFFRVL